VVNDALVGAYFLFVMFRAHLVLIVCWQIDDEFLYVEHIKGFSGHPLCSALGWHTGAAAQCSTWLC